MDFDFDCCLYPINVHVHCICRIIKTENYIEVYKVYSEVDKKVKHERTKGRRKG